MREPRVSLPCFLVLACAFLLGSTAGAQMTDVTGDQAPPIAGAGHDYIKMLNETVNPGNGTVSIRIGVPIPASRGLSVPFTFDYDSGADIHMTTYPTSNTTTGFEWVDNTSYLAQGGWSYGVPRFSTIYNTIVTGTNTPSVCFYFTNYMLTDIAGGSHALGLSSAELLNNSQCGGGGGSIKPEYLAGADAQIQSATSAYSTTGTTSPTPPPVTSTDMDGTVYYFSNSNAHKTSIPGSANSAAESSLPDWIEDRNGNRAMFSDQGNGAFTITDTAGRTALTSSGFGTTGNTITVSGVSGSYQVTWQNFTSTANPLPLPYHWCYTQSNCQNGNGPGTIASSPRITQITLPNGLTYKFQYDAVSTLLSKVIYPAGGYVQYVWSPSSGGYFDELYSQGVGTVQHASFVVTKRTVSFDGTTAALEQDFAYATTWGSEPAGFNTWSQRVTTVTTKDLIGGTSYNTVYTYAPFGIPAPPNTAPGGVMSSTPVENLIQYYDTSGSLVRTVTKSYVDPHLPPDTTTSLQNNQTSKVHNAYISRQSGSGCVSACNLGVLTDKYEYDYGSGSPGNLLRQTHTDYSSFATTPLFPSAASILDRPSDVITYDGGGNKAAETDYAYDQTTLGSVSATGHDDTNYGTSQTLRGNLTTRTKKCFVGSTACSDSITTYTYDQTGHALTSKDACGNGTCGDMTGSSHTSTYGYADSYTTLSNGQNVPYTPTGNTNAFLTQITDPLGHISKFTYDFNNSQLTAAKDQNDVNAGRSGTTYVYNDFFARPTQLNYPDGGQGEITYIDTAPSPTVTACQLINGSAGASCNSTTPPPGWKTTVATMDGMGHTARTTLLSDPENPDAADTTYDGVARVRTQSNPYRTGASSTDGTSTHNYDPLGRVTSVVEQDGSTATTTYSGNCTTVTDEAGKIRKSCSDALGRLIEVDEPGTGAVTGTAGTGSVTISGSEQSSSGTHGSASIGVSNGSEGCSSNGHGGYIPAYGTISVVVQGITSSTSWGGSCDGGGSFTLAPTMNQIASNLASALASSSAGVTAVSSGTGITITATATGASTNYTLSYSSTGGGVSAFGPSSLSGGQDAATDSGTFSVTVNGFVASQNYASGSTAQSITSGLAALLNSGTSPVNAAVSGNVITMTAREVGAVTNYSFSASSTWNTQSFSNPSFSGSPSSGTLAGGTDPGLGSSPLVTLYAYNALDDLTCAVQKGTDITGFTTCAAASSTWRPRLFVYDSLSRLTSANNPESGTITYAYDANGNLTTKTAPKPNPGNTGTISISYSYDALNRLLKKTYSGGIATTAANYAYDGNALSCPGPGVLAITGASNLIGRRSAMCSNSSASSWSYDPMGRPVMERTNVTGNVNKSVTYSYDLDGSLKALTYPSGDVVTYTHTGAGRVSNVSDAANNYVAPPSTAPMYPASGLLVGMKNGTAITTLNAYNSRLQPAALSAETAAATLMSLSYDFHSGNGDNGNVFQVINNLDSTRSAAFQYDALNRIQQANTVTTTGANCWGEVYTIDAWGNLTNRSGPSGMSGCNTEPLNATASTKNQLSTLSYDLAGNVTNDGNGNLPTYDSENRMVSDAGMSYSYDADGNRMEKSSGTLYWYGSGGETLAESNLSGTINAEYIFFNGNRLARVDRPSGTVHYYFSDDLSSSSVIADASGNVQQQYFYYPYGGIVAQVGSDTNHYKFTGKERDSESGLDNFGARFDSSSLGRFMTPDWAARPTAVPYALFGDPQSLNLYGYVRNDPVSNADADGHAAAGGPCYEQDPCDASDRLDHERQQETQSTTAAQQQTAGDALRAAMSPAVENFLDIGGTDANFNHISYDIASKDISQVTAVEGDLPDVKTIGSGYSGKGAGLDNPRMEDVQGAKGKTDAGPIPEGTYSIGKQQMNVTGTGTKLPASMRLTPDPGNEMHNRGGFLIHGDNAAGNHSASDGCIVTNRATRDAIANTGYSILVVLP